MFHTVALRTTLLSRLVHLDLNKDETATGATQRKACSMTVGSGADPIKMMGQAVLQSEWTDQAAFYVLEDTPFTLPFTER